MVNLEDYNEVCKAIIRLDESGYFGLGLSHLFTDISWLGSGDKWSKYSHAPNEIQTMAERFAKECLLRLMRNQKHLAEEKADELWNKYTSISEDNREAKAKAYEAYSDMNDTISDLEADCAEIENHIIAEYVSGCNDPFKH